MVFDIRIYEIINNGVKEVSLFLLRWCLDVFKNEFIIKSYNMKVL